MFEYRLMMRLYLVLKCFINVYIYKRINEFKFVVLWINLLIDVWILFDF